MLLLDKEDIKKVFTMKDSIAAVKQAFVYIAEGKCDAPLRTRIDAPKNGACFLFMPAYVADEDAASIKIVNQFPHNPEIGLPTSPANVLLFDGKTGMCNAILDGTYVTQSRTGAASGAAFEVLGRKDCEIGAMIGTGGQAPAQLEAMLCARQLKEVRIFDRKYEKACAFAEKMQEELASYGAKIVAAKTSDEAIDNADLLITVTSADKPVFDGSRIKPGCTISCVGAYQYHMQECDPVALTRASKIYFDSKEAVLSESGDILQPLDQGLITDDDLTGDLGQVIRGELVGRESDEEIIVFETVGVATQDLCAARAIYSAALEAGVGLRWGE